MGLVFGLKFGKEFFFFFFFLLGRGGVGLLEVV